MCKVNIKHFFFRNCNFSFLFEKMRVKTSWGFNLSCVLSESEAVQWRRKKKRKTLCKHNWTEKRKRFFSSGGPSSFYWKLSLSSGNVLIILTNFFEISGSSQKLKMVEKKTFFRSSYIVSSKKIRKNLCI